MFRRRAGRQFRGFQPPAVPPLLQRAHRMMVEGDFENAAVAFYELARKAEERFPERAPMLYLEAGRAAILCGQVKKGVVHFRSGLTLLATQRRVARMQMLGQRIVGELQERGLSAEAEEITRLIKDNLPPDFAGKSSTLPKPPSLPTHCPACGATVKPNEVEWLDESTAECDYCGSPVRGN